MIGLTTIETIKAYFTIYLHYKDVEINQSPDYYEINDEFVLGITDFDIWALWLKHDEADEILACSVYMEEALRVGIETFLQDRLVEHSIEIAEKKRPKH